MDFLLDNILLIAIILVCSVSLAWPMIQRRRTGPEVDNSSATELINRKNAQIIDLRDPKDFKKEAIANSVNIPADFKKECSARSVNIPADRIQNELGKLNKTRPVLLVDDDGRRSRMASPLLRGTGFKEVYILAGGLNAWRMAKLPFAR